MMGARAELHDLVRVLRQELAWAVRTGGVIDAPVARQAPQTSSLPAPAVELQFLPGEDEPARVVSSVVAAESPQQVALTLADIRAELGECTRCKLHQLGRRQIVFGVGNPHAELMFIGEGPGANEDLKGEPFVGDAGQLLTKIIEAMGFARSDVYIANVVKCRPPNNRDPEPDEVASCEPFLKQQIASIRPKVIVTLGKYASQTILRSPTAISRLRGTWGTYEGTPVMPTYHPAYLLRNPEEKRPVWDDMKKVLAALGREAPQRVKQ